MKNTDHFKIPYPETTDPLSQFPDQVAKPTAELIDTFLYEQEQKQTALDAALAGKASLTHTHPQSQVTGLDSALQGKAPLSHTHSTSQVTGLDAALAGKAPQSTLDARIPAGLALRVDNSVGTRIFAGSTMIYGDTGWRAIALWGKDGSLTGELPTGITAQSENGGIYYRRINGTVTIRILAARAESSNFQIPIPTGFAPGGAPWPVVSLSLASLSNSAYIRVGSAYAYVGISGASASNPVNLPSSGASYSSEATWGTDRSWPTSLPGTPA